MTDQAAREAATNIELEEYAPNRGAVGYWAKAEIAALNKKTETEGWNNFCIGLIPSAVVLSVVLVSICQINSDKPWYDALLYLTFDRVGIFNEKYQQWYIGMLTIFAASWGIYIARLPIIEKRREERQKTIDNLIVAERKAISLGYEAILLVKDCKLDSYKMITTNYFDLSKHLENMPASLSIIDPFSTVQESYINLQTDLIEYLKIHGNVDSCDEALQKRAVFLIYHIDRLIKPRLIDPEKAKKEADERKTKFDELFSKSKNGK